MAHQHSMSNTPYQPVFVHSNPYSQPTDSRESYYDGPEAEHLQPHHDAFAAGSSQPRFFPGNRESFASSNPTLTGDYHDRNGSSIALNDKPGYYTYNDSGDVGMPPRTGPSPYLNEKTAFPAKRSRKKAIIIGVLAVLAAAVAAGVVVYFLVIKPKSSKSSPSANTSGANDTSTDNGKSDTTKNNLVVTGGDGSTVTTDAGDTFTYTNSFGGVWYYNPENPLESGARAQSFTPALNETFKFGEDPIRGVNVGGWLVTEPFIVPALYEKYINGSTPAFDEFDLTTNMRADGSLSDLENHYATFITEQDFAEIAAAGLNFVRIPIAYWAIETRENEPFLAQTSWKYFLKAVQWARKYGLRINLDLHALPGSQNGWNHSGRLGNINVLYGPMGINNAERSLDYIRIIAEFVSQPEYSDVIVMFGLTNEPFGPTIGKDAISRYYVQAYSNVRTASGNGNGPWIVMHDAFMGLPNWAGFLPNADRVQLDIHQYLCFNSQSADDYTVRTAATIPCGTWGTGQNASMSAFGMTHVGEFSNAINDCGQWLNGINIGARFDGSFTPDPSFKAVGSCETYLDYTQWDQQWKDSMKLWALQSMSALQNWFFWTWKIGNSTVTGRPPSPAWSYQLGLQEGWMPTDPRAAEGVCDDTAPFAGTITDGSGQVPQTFLDTFTWPPASLTNEPDLATLPQYTQTGTIITLPPPAFTSGSSTISASTGNGWNNPSDTAFLFVPVASCGFLDPWIGPSATMVTCPPVQRREDFVPRAAAPTPPPMPRR
ncbi:glycoside hydrolase [Epithele typhae]|uniref:glycoside hydrolase n=1 Tax=Epithele typhae TaxID=378194 RepID=UPI002007BB6E|nr:glycoside hydrolase [Epithele typhae]KAH9945946.1 glycoside hydrolase [Epithele typhae]